MKSILLILASVIGSYFIARGFLRNLGEYRKKPKSQLTNTDRYFNFPLVIVWYAYLLVFFLGLTVNNLIIK